MKNLKIKCDDKSFVKLKKLAKCVYEELGQKDKLVAEVEFVDETEIKRLNREFRNVDKVTDVLSFPTLDGIRGTVVKAEDFPYDVDLKGRVMIGSIAVCVSRAKEQAAEYKHSEEREFTYLVLHGLLHLMGYDHTTEEDKKQMRDIEKRVCAKIGIGDEE